MSGIRMIVTGHDAQGRSTVVSDEVHEPTTSPGSPGVEINYLWGADAAQNYPDDGAMPEWSAHFPSAGGFRFTAFTRPPADFVAPESASSPEALADANDKFKGLLDTYEDDDPGMHTSLTTDMAIVLSGEVVLGLRDGSETVLRAGDTIVQNGTAHSWQNRGSEPARMLFVLVGAEKGAAS
jgi:mannose-6-phosphate isomerase-like protein (cupin superfamily)